MEIWDRKIPNRSIKGGLYYLTRQLCKVFPYRVRRGYRSWLMSHNSCVDTLKMKESCNLKRDYQSELPVQRHVFELLHWHPVHKHAPTRKRVQSQAKISLGTQKADDYYCTRNLSFTTVQHFSVSCSQCGWYSLYPTSLSHVAAGQITEKLCNSRNWQHLYLNNDIK